jgi:hypothetical protein
MKIRNHLYKVSEDSNQSPAIDTDEIAVKLNVEQQKIDAQSLSQPESWNPDKASQPATTENTAMKKQRLKKMASKDTTKEVSCMICQQPHTISYNMIDLLQYKRGSRNSVDGLNKREMEYIDTGVYVCEDCIPEKE